MRLNGKFLKNVAGVNHFEYSDEAHIQEGQINEFYLQLFDIDKEIGDDCYLRYIPIGTLVTLSLQSPSVDDSKIVTLSGAQPFPQDLSIWKFTVPSSSVPNSGSVNVVLTIDGVVSKFVIQNALQVSLLNNGGC